jgi:competence protein ComEC
MRFLTSLLLFATLLLVPSNYSPAVPIAVNTLSSAAATQVTRTVYVTRTGEKYHRDGCRYLSRSKIPMSLKDAKASGYAACKICQP